jgi:hypothetical protein
MNLRFGYLLAICLSVCLVACGGGGGGGGSPTSTPTSSGTPPVVPPPTDSFGAAVSLQIYPDLPERTRPGSEVTLKVHALNAAGVAKDVTAQARVSANVPNMLGVSSTGSLLGLAFSGAGTVAVRIEALGLSLDRNVLVSQRASNNLQGIELHITNVYSGLVANADKSYSLLPGKDLLITASAIYDNDTENISHDVQIVSTDSSKVLVRPAVNTGGGIPWRVGQTLAPGVSKIEARWGGHQTSLVINVSKGLVLRAGSMRLSGITENAAGRATAYILAGNEAFRETLWYSTSSYDNQWSTLVPLATPASVITPQFGLKVAESANGYRAIVSSSNREKWVHLVGPSGEVKGPIIISNSGEAYPLSLVMSSDGIANLWFYERGVIRRHEIRFSDLRLSTINTIAINNSTADYLSSDTGPPQVAVALDGTIGIAWIDNSCQLHYVLDKISNLGSYNSNGAGVVRVRECSQGYFSNIDTKFDIAAGGNEMAVALQYGTGLNTTNIELITVNASAQASSKLVEQDSAHKSGSPKIAMTGSGEFVATWATGERGIWAVHRPSGREVGTPFLVEAPFFSLGTPAVDGAYARGDGRFVIVWPGGPGRSRLELRNYSSSAGLGERLSFPYQNTTASNHTSFVMSPYGISAAWSFPVDFSTDEYNAMQRFLP